MGKIVIDSAIQAGVEHMIHASLPYATKLTNGKVPMISFDGMSIYTELLAVNLQDPTSISSPWMIINIII